MDREDEGGSEHGEAGPHGCVTCTGLAARVPEPRHALPVVFGEGDATVRVMFVGQGPGIVEEQTGQPFTCPSGRLLDQALAEVGLRTEAHFG